MIVVFPSEISGNKCQIHQNYMVMALLKSYNCTKTIHMWYFRPTKYHEINFFQIYRVNKKVNEWMIHYPIGHASTSNIKHIEKSPCITGSALVHPFTLFNPLEIPRSLEDFILTKNSICSLAEIKVLKWDISIFQFFAFVQWARMYKIKDFIRKVVYFQLTAIPHQTLIYHEDHLKALNLSQSSTISYSSQIQDKATIQSQLKNRSSHDFKRSNY